ncbi:transketolase C-terminal domain-containing protein [Chloroflexota bacterium]
MTRRSGLMMGNIAIAEGAIAAGCRFFAGYPITPANEISEHLSLRLPEEGGIFIQMEDELSSAGAVIGAIWGGMKGMTATSGPGFSLMQEHIGMAVSLEVPIIIALMQRVGPSGGGIGEMSGEIMQAKWGSQGDYSTIALAPWSCQECFDLTIEAFNQAGTWRVPVIIFGDALLAHMFEPVIRPTEEERRDRVKEWPKHSGDPKKCNYFTYDDPVTKEPVVPPLPVIGTPYHPRWAFYGTHTPKGILSESEKVAFNLIRLINDKINLNRDTIVRYDSRFMEDAEIALICYGTVGRPVLRAVKEARSEGIKVGFLRLITVWPFADQIVEQVCHQVKVVIVPEMNYGQIIREVERVGGGSGCRIQSYPKAGLHEASELLQRIKEAAKW